MKVRTSNKSNYDIFFLSYSESNREKHWYSLKKRFPQSRRIHGLKGIGLAHQTCAQLSRTPFFFVVNADNEILKNFQFDITPPIKKAVYTWRSINPCNGLVYGFGAIKLFPKDSHFLSSYAIDFSTSLKIPYQIVQKIASITHFNSSPLEAWRGAFRECAKLASQCIHQQKSPETIQRLKIWCHNESLVTNQHLGFKHQKTSLTNYQHLGFNHYAVLGACQGKLYGEKHRHSKQDLQKLNDFNWLENIFNKNIKNKQT